MTFASASDDWVPEAEASSTTDAATDEPGDLNSEATCTIHTARGLTEDLAAGTLSARVYRDGSLADTGEERAVEAFAAICDDVAGTGIGVGDESCTTYRDVIVSTGHVAVQVRSGADLISVTYYATDATEAGAAAVATDAAGLALRALP